MRRAQDSPRTRSRRMAPELSVRSLHATIARLRAVLQGKPVLVSVSIFLVAVTVIVGLGLSSLDQAHPRERLGFTHGLSDASGELTYELIESRIDRFPLKARQFETNRRIEPTWLRTEMPARVQPGVQVFEIASRHLISAEVWVRERGSGRLVLQDKADNDVPGERLSSNGSGFHFLFSPEPGVDYQITARVVSVSVSKVDAFVWNPTEFTQARRTYQMASGFLFGALAVLSVSVLLAGFRSQDPNLFVMAGWLVTSLAMAGMTEGFILHWARPWMSYEDMPALRQLAMTLYGYFSVQATKILITDELKRFGGYRLLRVIEVATLVAIVMAQVLPFWRIIHILWTIYGVGASALIGMTLFVAFKARTASSKWYMSATLIQLGVSILVILSAAHIIGSLPSGVNLVGSTLVSAFLTLVALAEKHAAQFHASEVSRQTATTLLQRYEESYNRSRMGLFTVSPDLRLKRCNQAFQELMAHHGKKVCDADLEHVFAGCVPPDAAAQLIRLDAQVQFDVRVAGADQVERILECSLTRTVDTVEGTLTDVTDLRKGMQALRQAADVDSLTGLLNRRAMHPAFSKAFVESRHGVRSWLVLINLECYRRINQLYGALAGDYVLQQAAARLKEAVPAGATLARGVGSNFIVVTSESSKDVVEAQLRTMHKALCGSPYTYGSTTLTLSARIRALDLNACPDEQAAFDVVERLASSTGGPEPVYAAETFDPRLQKELAFTGSIRILREHLPLSRLTLHFQPIISLAAPHRSFNAEALLRVREEDRLVPPSQLLLAAEQAGLMPEVDRWAVSHVLRAVESTPVLRELPGFVTLNLSGASLNDPQFVDHLLGVLKDHPKSVDRLVFEIPESTALVDLSATRQIADSLRTLGAGVALDDFGRGYTSFAYLKEIPADYLKIDGTFVRDMAQSNANFSIVRSLVEIAHRLDIRCIAEWTESLERLRMLQEIDVDFAQGWGLASPMSLADLRKADTALSLIQDPMTRLNLQALDYSRSARQPSF